MMFGVCVRATVASWCLIGCCLGADAVVTDASTEQKKKLAAVASFLDESVAGGEVAGVVHLIGMAGQRTFEHAVGVRDIESGQPLDADTVVRIYSMTKPITSVAAMVLWEQGKFKLDDPVALYIPSFKNSTVWDPQSKTAVSPKRPITVRDTFRHTTGYGYSGGRVPELEQQFVESGLLYRPPAGMFPPDMSLQAAMDKLAGIPARHHPGERFTYGFSTDLLGRLIEVWSGKPLDQFLREAVLAPLQMNDTAFAVAAEHHARFASCHTTEDGKLVVVDKADSSPFLQGFAFLSGGGGLTSTANDYAKFCEMMVQGGQRNGVQILRADTLKRMYKNQLEDALGGFQFGLGFAIGPAKIGREQQQQTMQQFQWGGYASTNFTLVPELRLYQIVIRQHVPTKRSLGGKAIQMGFEALNPEGSAAEQ